MKLSPIENKNKNKTRKETKTHNSGFVWGLLVLGDVSASPQSQGNAGATYPLFTKASVTVWVRTVSHKHTNLNTRSPVGDAVPGALGGTAFLEEVRHWGWAPRISITSYLQSSFCFMLAFEDVSCQLPASATLPALLLAAMLLPTPWRTLRPLDP